MVSRPFVTFDGIAVAEIAFYSVFLAGALFLCIRHGFGKSAGWRFLLAFSLARLVGSSLRLATLHDATNIGLYVGWVVTEGLGLGPLVLTVLGLLGRVFDSINRQGHVVIRPIFNQAIQILMLVGIILTIVGGTQASYAPASSGGFPKVDYPTTSKVGTSLMIVVVALVCFTVVLVLLHQSRIAQGERRIVPVAAACMPFIIVRTAYSAMKVLGGVQSSAYVTLGMSTIMEMIVVLLCEAVGLTLAKVVPPPVDPESLPLKESKKSPFGALFGGRRQHHAEF